MISSHTVANVVPQEISTGPRQLQFVTRGLEGDLKQQKHKPQMGNIHDVTLDKNDTSVYVMFLREIKCD
jgi:hypothetical protein